MAEQSSTSAIQHLTDALLGQQSSHDITLALAILIYLRWADFQEAELDAIAAFDDTTYEPVLPASLHWQSWHHMGPDKLYHVLLERLYPALGQLGNSRHNLLATHLHRLAGTMETLANLQVQTLVALVEWLSEQPFETPTDRRQMLYAFDDFLEASRDKYAGEFKTPLHVARLMVELAAPTMGESVYDPCFGSAGLLTNAFDYALRNAAQKTARHGEKRLSIFGIELKESAYIIGLARMALAGIDDPQIELGNSLERTPPNNPEQDGFDVVLANPPWGGRQNLAGLDHFPIRTSASTGLFIQHALSQLRPQGRAVIIVPEGFLFRSGAEQQLRRMLVEQHTVEAVISLPTAVFMPYAGLKTSILVLKRGGKTERIRMFDANTYFEQGKGRQPTTISEAMSLKLAGHLRAVEPAENSWDVDVAALAEVEWDFSPRRRDQGGLSGVLDVLRSKVEVQLLKECCHITTGRGFKSMDFVDPYPHKHSDGKYVASMTRFEKDYMRVNTIEELIPYVKKGYSIRMSNQRSHRTPSLISPGSIDINILDKNLIRYVRIKDVEHGHVTKGSSLLSPEASSAVDTRWKLRAGDVLLSKSGTIGKVGVVRDDAVGAIATSGLYVLRVDSTRLDPHYLAAYLDSSDCRAWLNDRSTAAATISHLSKRVIEEIPVPLPSLQLQHRVAAEYHEHGVDVLAYLTQLLTGGKRDPIVEWIEKKLKELPAEIDRITDSIDFTFLDQLVSHARPLRNEMAHGSQGDSTLVPWLLAFNEAMSVLRGVSEMPHGPGLLSVLQESATGLKRAEEFIKGHLPNEDKARQLTNIVAGWLFRGAAALLNDVHLVFSIDDSTLRAGEVQELDLRVLNNSPLPLREIEITFDPEWGSGSFKYLAENASETIGLRAVAPKAAGPLTLNVHWSILTLDGRHVDGKREIAFETLPGAIRQVSAVVDLGNSPYVCGTEIRPERDDIFFGREDLIDQIRRQVITSGNVILLEGNRRSGKSSILRHLEGLSPIPGWLSVFCSFQGMSGNEQLAGVSTVEIFRKIAAAISQGFSCLGIATPLPNGKILQAGKKIGIRKACKEGISEDSPFDDFLDYIEVALDATQSSNLGILLMLDEFDKLQEGIDNKITSPQVPENIRFLVLNYPRLSAILTGSRRLKRLREEYWSALFGLGTRLDVTSLPLEAAQKLVTEPVKGRLAYSREAVESAVLLTNRQPFLLQSLCNEVFIMAARLKFRSITSDIVDQAGNILAENNEHFATLWDYIRSDRRRFILGLIHKGDAGPDPLRFGVLQELLSNYSVEVSDETLIADLVFLRELELIELVGEPDSGYYTLSIPLMGRWIDRQHDFVVLQKKARMQTEDDNG